MLPRAQRLTSREFAVVFDKARVLRHPLLHLRSYKRDENERVNNERAGKLEAGSKLSKRETRAAFVAPKKLGNAVVRNAIRRRVRERYRILHAKLLQSQRWDAALENCDLVFFATSDCTQATIQQIDESLAQLLKRAARS